MCGRIRVLGIKEYSKMQSHHLFLFGHILYCIMLWKASMTTHPLCRARSGIVPLTGELFLVERLLRLLSSSAHLSKPHQHVLYLETLTQTWDL